MRAQLGYRFDIDIPVIEDEPLDPEDTTDTDCDVATSHPEAGGGVFIEWSESTR